MPKQPATPPVLAPLPERESAHDRSVNSIREGRFREVGHAAQALVDDSFSG
jgi:hypothetical protein